MARENHAGILAPQINELKISEAEDGGGRHDGRQRRQHGAVSTGEPDEPEQHPRNRDVPVASRF